MGSKPDRLLFQMVELLLLYWIISKLAFHSRGMLSLSSKINSYTNILEKNSPEQKQLVKLFTSHAENMRDTWGTVFQTNDT